MGVVCFVQAAVAVVSKTSEFWSMIKILRGNKGASRGDGPPLDRTRWISGMDDVNADGRARRRIFISFWHGTQMTTAVA